MIVPDYPEIPFIEGDGIGRDISMPSRIAIDSAVRSVYGDRRKISWIEVYAGEKARERFGESMPEATLETIKAHGVALKGPLATPVGTGIRSLNVMIRMKLDLYACVRPVKYIDPVPSPMKHPENIDIVVFRENMEDVYSGIEFQAGAKDTREVASFLKEKMGITLTEDTGIGIKPISERNTQRLVASAISYAIDNGLQSVTLMHKGNIMKYTEGAFNTWGYEVARERFGDRTISEEDALTTYQGNTPEGKVVIKDRIADMLFQQVLLRPEEFDVIATPNLNGDYLSDALAAQVGGLGMAPGANIGEDCAVFEATHGTAPKYAGQDRVNPSSLILSGAMMLDYMGWVEASAALREALSATIRDGVVTYDLARQMDDPKEVRCSEFAAAIADKLN